MLKNSFLTREIFILVVTIVLVFAITTLLSISGTNYVIQDMPFFGNVVFEDFHSCLVFCTKLAIVLIYVIRPIVYIVLWGFIERRDKKKL